MIIAYFFPPCCLTAANRALYWAKYLKDYGYEPIVITRKWDHEIKSPADMGKSSFEQEKLIDEQDGYKVVYVPYKGSRRDRLFIEKPQWKVLRKTLTLKELFGQNYSAKALPYYNIYEESKAIVEKEGIKKVVITGNPFPCFQFGYLLKKEFKDLNWIADYRDDWTTTELSSPQGVVGRELFKLEQKSEQKWVGTASLITSVSEYYVNKISHFVGVKGTELLNGFDEKIEALPAFELANDRFIITYNGSLYPSQKIEPLLEVFSELIHHFKDKIRIELKFPGLDFDPMQGKRVRNLLKDVMDHVTITDRIDRDEVLEMQRESHLLLMITHEGIKGIPSSKLYEYIGLQKPVLLYPSDNDIIEKTLKDCSLGIICEDETDIENKLSKFIKDFILNGENSFSGDIQKIDKYHRKQQVKKLATLLDKL